MNLSLLIQRTARLLTAITGILVLGVAVFANVLGIDHNARWGNSRILLAVLGSCLILLAITLYLSPVIFPWSARLRDRVRSGRGYQALAAWAESFAPFRWARTMKIAVSNWGWVAHFRNYPDHLAVCLAILTVIVGLFSYTWYINAGRLNAWEAGTIYFDRQAQAYLHGQLALLDRPDPQLLSLPNPYDYRQRTGVPVFWDASLYQGKYYLYWGPAPALVALLVQLGTHIWLDDRSLTLLFISLTLVTAAVFVLRIRRELYPRLPGWVVLLPLLLIGFANPVLYVLDRPSVYEAAITGGQAFFWLGLVCAWFGVWDRRQRLAFLPLAGLCWGLAVGSRADLLPGIAWASLLVCAALIFYRPAGNRISRLALFTFPLLAVGAGLAWYNYARFGSILETGHRYQLTGLALPADYSQIFSLGYIIPNFYTYVLRPLSLQRIFPFVTAPWVKETSWPFFIHLPPVYYYSEPMAGILTAVPAAWLSFLLPAALLTGRREKPRIPSDNEGARGGLLWLCILLIGMVIVQTGILLIFVAASMRYELDLLPLLAMISGLGAWEIYSRLGKRPFLRQGFCFLVFLLLLATVFIGLLLGFSGASNHFEMVNPALYSTLVHLLHP